MDKRVAGKYIINNKLGNGNFGSVFKGKHYKNNKDVAIKLEPTETSFKLLQHETMILKYLHEHDSRNIPTVYWYGLHDENVCLVMPLYDCSLYDYIVSKNDIADGKIRSIVYQLISIFESIHNNCVIHRDVKPQNIMLKNGELCLIDFGFSVFYIDGDGEHIEDECSDTIIGSPKYVSYYVHTGSMSSRRDDLISLGYLYLFLFQKSLPWENIPNDDSIVDDYDETSIYNYKNLIRQNMKVIDTILYKTKQISINLYNYIKYVYNLKYDDKPDYHSLRKII